MTLVELDEVKEKKKPLWDEGTKKILESEQQEKKLHITYKAP